jgi:hypothetical protein
MALVTHAALKGVQRGGLVPEDVMAKIWDISKIPLPLQDLIGTDSHNNEYAEWVKDKLAAPTLANALIDGSDAPTDSNKLGTRVGNHSQISGKTISASTRAREGATLNMGDAYAYQLMRRQQETKRDIDAIALSNQGSAVDDGSTVPGKSAGFDAWLTTNTNNGATGSNGGFNPATGLVAPAVPGTARALSETAIRNIAQSVWEGGGNPSVLMGRPAVIRKLSAYMFSTSAQVATLTSDVRQSRGAAVATGSVNVFVTDFGVTLEMVANRLQQPTSAGVSSLFIIDPEYAAISYLMALNAFSLSKTGLADKGMCAADWTLKVMSEEAHGVIRGIDETAAPVALSEDVLNDEVWGTQGADMERLEDEETVQEISHRIQGRAEEWLDGGVLPVARPAWRSERDRLESEWRLEDERRDAARRLDEENRSVQRADVQRGDGARDFVRDPHPGADPGPNPPLELDAPAKRRRVPKDDPEATNPGLLGDDGEKQP